jgi:hypothetical protein
VASHTTRARSGGPRHHHPTTGTGHGSRPLAPARQAGTAHPVEVQGTVANSESGQAGLCAARSRGEIRGVAEREIRRVAGPGRARP